MSLRGHTDWRIGASRGYEINTALFPDMARFLKQVHERHARVVFNDHPEPPQAPGAHVPSFHMA